MILEKIDDQIAEIILALFCIFLLFIALKLARAKSLLASSIYLALFSVFISCLYLIMDAPDVAMTETALGACLSTSVFLGFLKTIKYNKNISETNNRQWKNIFAALFCFTSVLVFVLIGLELPIYGQINNPVQTGASSYYLANTYKQIGIPSVVTAILASYRGFDTLAETSVILIGALGSLLILPSDQNQSVKISTTNLKQHLVLKIITDFIFCFIILYSFYLQLSGETSPGGGFQAGVIFASGLIAYDLIYGYQKHFFSSKALTFIAVFGVLLYFSVGIISLIFGDDYLNYYRLSFGSVKGQFLGIFLVELGVGFTVASTLYLIYSLFQKS